MTKDTGGPAFPNENYDRATMNGMTMRDYFAGKCDIEAYSPAKTFADRKGRYPSVEELAAYIAQIRYYEADAMLKAREP